MKPREAAGATEGSFGNKTVDKTTEERVEPGGAVALKPAKESLSGFRNLLGKENGEWTTGLSLVAHAAIWLVVVALVSATVAFVRSEVLQDQSPKDLNDAGALMFFVLGSVASVIAVVAKTQGAIIGEQQLGTAAWVLSKPASRRAFVLAKLVIHFRWLFTVTLLLPAVVFYVLMTAISTVPPPPLAFLAGFGILALGLLFYLSLSLLLGTVFESRGALAGCVFGFMVAGFLVANYATWLAGAFPWLFFQYGYNLVKLGSIPLYGIVSLPATALWCVLFIFLALRRFSRAEL